MNTQEQTAPRASYHNPGQKVELLVPIKVNEYLLACTLCTALEGGSNYWCLGWDITPTDLVVTERAPDEVANEFWTRNVALGGTLTLYEDENETGDIEDCTKHVLTRERLIAGLAALLNTGRVSLGGREDDGSADLDLDAGDADYILQNALFGKQVYG